MGTIPRPCGGARGALRGSGVGLIPIHPILYSARQGTISPARLPLRLHGDPWPHVYGCCPWALYASILLLSAIFTPFDFPAGHCRHPHSTPDWLENSSALLPTPASPPETLKPSANTTWSGSESAYNHLFMTFWFRPQGAAQTSSSQWMDRVTEVLLQGRRVVTMHHTWPRHTCLDSICGPLLHVKALSHLFLTVCIISKMFSGVVNKYIQISLHQGHKN